MDYSCVEGFCPSFVTVHGGTPRKGRKIDASERLANLPMPATASDLSQPWNILLTGVGGTGLLHTGALLGIARHPTGRRSDLLDPTAPVPTRGRDTPHIPTPQ